MHTEIKLTPWPTPFKVHLRTDKLQPGCWVPFDELQAHPEVGCAAWCLLSVAVACRHTGKILWRGARYVPVAKAGRPLNNMTLQVDARRSLFREFWRYLGAA